MLHYPIYGRSCTPIAFSTRKTSGIGRLQCFAIEQSGWARFAAGASAFAVIADWARYGLAIQNVVPENDKRGGARERDENKAWLSCFDTTCSSSLSVYLVHIYFNWNSKGTGLEVYSPWWDNFARADRVGGEFGLPWIPVSCDCLLCLAVSSSWACDAA